MRVGVTGAAGFVAGWLIPELAGAGHEVVGCDQVPGPHVADVFDLTEPGAVRAWMKDYSLDAIAHLGAQVGRLFGEDDLVRTVRANAEATTLLAHAAGELGVRVVYTSTSEIYGDHGDQACYESSLWRLPGNLYGLTKRWGEEVLGLYAPEGLVICRLSMPYGPGAPPGRGRRAMDNLLWQAHHRLTMTVHRGAERSWCWAGDTARGIRLAMEQPGEGTYNIGRSDDAVSMEEIAVRACDLARVPAQERADLIRLVDPPPGQIAVKRLDCRRIESLGWRPLVGLEEGMLAVYEYVRNYDAQGNLP